MDAVDIHALLDEILAGSPLSPSIKVRLPEFPGGALVFQIDGPLSTNNICIWPSGQCDIQSVSTTTEQFGLEQFAFVSLAEATATVQEQISLAIQRSGLQHRT